MEWQKNTLNTNVFQAGRREATLKTPQDVERLWMCCIFSHYLFISVSSRRGAPTLRRSRCPKLETDFGEVGRCWMLFWVLKERLDQEWGNFMVLGFEGGYKKG